MHNDLYRPLQGRKAMLTFESCKEVEVAGNRVAPDVLGENVAAGNLDPAEIATPRGQGIARPEPS